MTPEAPTDRKAGRRTLRVAMALAFAVLLVIPAAAEARSKAGVSIVQVKRGDTVHRIARRHGVTARTIIRLNRLRRPYRLLVGQRLRLRSWRYHRVKRGESLSRLAVRYRVRMAKLIKLNRLQRPYRLRIGQRLRVPSRRHAARPAAMPKRTRAAENIRSTRRRSARGGARRKASRIVVAPRRPVGRPPALSGRGFRWPVLGRVIGRFGRRPGGQRNDGVNIAAPAGSVVRAAENGIVAYAGSDIEGFGELLLIKHADGWVTAYAHNDRFLVRRGQRVRRGQPIARVGSTGAVLRAQLHFEIRKGKRPINPLTKLRRVRRLAGRTPTRLHR